jgi:hypothetical protein
MLEVKSTGIGHLETYLKELQDAAAALHLNFPVPEFDATDEKSLQAAIARMETLVDERVAPWKHNPTVHGMAEEAKRRFRDDMKKKATPA